MADCRDWLAALPDQSVHMALTSPPYWSLRDYQVDGQLGQEATVEEYVGNLVHVFSDLRRVLRNDGTFWLNLGDCYDRHKQLVGVPWRVALALQDAGWVLRNDIVWAKKNPLPESVRDRLTSSHEHLFFFAKARRYFFDRAAIRETGVGGWRHRRDVWTLGSQSFKGAHVAVMPQALAEPPILAGTSAGGCCGTCGLPFEPERETVIATSGRRPRSSEYSQRDARFTRGGAFQGAETTTLGWNPACACEGTTPMPCLVADPFAGAGTSGVVSLQHGRRFIGCDLNAEFAALAAGRFSSFP